MQQSLTAPTTLQANYSFISRGALDIHKLMQETGRRSRHDEHTSLSIPKTLLYDRDPDWSVRSSLLYGYGRYTWPARRIAGNQLPRSCRVPCYGV